MATETLEVTIEGETLDLEIGTVAAPSGGTSVHNNLTGRDTAAAHPMAAIDGLVAALAAKEASGTAATAVAAHAVAADPHGDRAFATAADATHAAAAGAHPISGVDGLATALALLAPLASPALTGTPTAPTPAGGTNTTQVATAAFVISTVAGAVAGLLEFVGAVDASTNPNYSPANKGDSYLISVAGKIGGASGKSVDVGDLVVASADNAGGAEAAVGTSWFVLEHNLTGALLTANALSELSGVAATARGNLGLGTSSTHNVPASGNAASGEVVKGSDTRLSDSRTPTAHDQGSDTITSTLLDVTGTTHTAAAGDDGKIYRFTHASGCAVTIPDTLSAGWSVGWVQVGNAQSTFAGSGSMVVANRQAHTKTAGQYASGGLLVQATNSVYLLGDTGA